MKSLYPWLAKPYQQIIHAFQQGYGHQALLFRSEPDIGTESLILQLAAWLICQGEHKPCGACHSCHLFQAGNHPDYYWVHSIDHKEIGIEQIRTISDKLNQHANQNGNKVVYLQGVDRLSEAGANALLKTLEEPRPQTYFLLQTALSATLLPTIYSRCQPWFIQTPNPEQSRAWLKSQLTKPENLEQIDTALRVNYSRPLAALACLEQGWLAKRHQFLSQFWRFYQRKDILQLLPYFDSDLLFHQLDWLGSFFLDSLKAKLDIAHYWICDDFQRAVIQFAQQNSLATLLSANKIIQDLRADLASIKGVNQELMLIDGLAGLLLAQADSPP